MSDLTPEEVHEMQVKDIGDLNRIVANVIQSYTADQAIAVLGMFQLGQQLIGKHLMVKPVKEEVKP